MARQAKRPTQLDPAASGRTSREVVWCIIALQACLSLPKLNSSEVAEIKASMICVYAPKLISSYSECLCGLHALARGMLILRFNIIKVL